MAYCGVDDVASAFPAFIRNQPGSVQDNQIQDWLDDAKAYIRALFVRRGIDPDTGTLSTDQANILRHLNRISGIQDLAHVLRYRLDAVGVMGQEDLQRTPLSPTRFADGRFARIEDGTFDKLFASTARTIDTAPTLPGSIAGGDQDPNTPVDTTVQSISFTKNQTY